MSMLRVLRGMDPEDIALANLGTVDGQLLVDLVDEAEDCSAADAIPSVKKYIQSLDRAYASERMQQARLRQKRMFQDKPKSFHTFLSSNVEKPDIPPLRAVVRRDAEGRPTGPVLTQAGDIRESVQEHFETLLRPPTGDPDAAYPWSDPIAIDSFQLRSTDKDPDFLKTHICDKESLHACIKSLARGKAPGPDGILNETYQYSPPELVDCVYELFQAMFRVGEIPSELTQTTTVLLYKKGDPTDLNNYRPVGLVSTIVKLWTKLVAQAVRDYAEEHQILSSSQAGFRPGHHTHIQTQLLALALLCPFGAEHVWL